MVASCPGTFEQACLGWGRVARGLADVYRPKQFLQGSSSIRSPPVAHSSSSRRLGEQYLAFFVHCTSETESKLGQVERCRRVDLASPFSLMK